MYVCILSNNKNRTIFFGMYSTESCWKLEPEGSEEDPDEGPSINEAPTPMSPHHRAAEGTVVEEEQMGATGP